MTLLEDIKRPFNLLSTAIAIVSLALSIYFYFETLQRREPFYLQHETTQIFNRSSSSQNLRLTDATGKQIDADVHLLEISLWNHGRQPIEAADIRTPVYLELAGENRIIDFSVARDLKPQISKMKVTAVPSADGSLKRLQVSWDHLDPGLGARVQIIYTGSKAPEVKFGGDILDAEIKNGASPLSRLVGANLATILSAALGALISESGRQTVKQVPQTLPKLRRRITKLLFVLAAYGVGALLFWLLLVGKSAPV